MDTLPKVTWTAILYSQAGSGLYPIFQNFDIVQLV